MVREVHTSKRPTILSAGRALMCAEAWQSGLLHRAYPSADVWASNPLVTSREFDPHRFHHHYSSGAVAVDAVTTPDHRPGDEPAATTVLDNIRFDGRIFQSRQSSPLHPKDELREQPLPRKADRSHCRPL